MIERKHLKSVSASTGIGMGRHSMLIIHVDVHAYNTHITKKEKITIGSIKKICIQGGRDGSAAKSI